MDDKKVQEATPAYNNKENLVKKTCKELGITQKELAERLGTHLTTVQKWASSSSLPNNTIKTIELLRENELLKRRLNKFLKAFSLIDEAKNFTDI